MKKAQNVGELKNAQVRLLPPIVATGPLRERKGFESDGDTDAWLEACVLEEAPLRHHYRFGEAVQRSLLLGIEDVGWH